MDVTANDVNNEHYISGTTYYPNDNLGSNIYLTNLPASTYTQDKSGNDYRCTAIDYGSNTAPNQVPTLPTQTQELSFLTYKSSSPCTGSSVAIKQTVDASGDAVAKLDADRHQGCTSGSAQYTACATYDTFGTHLLKSVNAKNQTTTYLYDTTATGGYGQWLMGTTDANGQTKYYRYDALGRLTAEIDPGDSVSSPTISYTYNNTCTAGSTDPCIEIVTTKRLTTGGSQTVSTQQWYDGSDNLVETKTTGPNLYSSVPRVASTLVNYTIFDTMGNATTTSKTYAVPASSGTGYLKPDLTQPRTVTSYDSLGRTLGTVTYQNSDSIVLTTSLSYVIQNGLSNFSTVDASTPFEQTITLDGYKHKSVVYTDALGRQRYTQDFTGDGSSGDPYTAIRTIQTNRDTVGDVTSTMTFDNTGTVAASQSTTYDGLGRKVGMNDSDAGNCQETPLPAGCSSSSDMATKWTYDNNGNVLSTIDPRNVGTYTSYDVLNRPLCDGTSSSAVNPCSSDADETYFYDSYDTSSNGGATFPTICSAPSGNYASDPIGTLTAETFTNGAGSGSRCYGYNQRGETDQSGLTVTADGKTVSQSVNMAYNDIGDETSFVYPDGEQVNYTYDANNYLRSAYLAAGNGDGTVNYLAGQISYTNDGLLSSIAEGGSAAVGSTPIPVLTTTLSYDGIQRTIGTKTAVGGSTIWSKNRTFDNVGDVVNSTTVVPTLTGGTQTESQSFCYDDLNRLVWAGNTGTPTGGTRCGLDPVGTTISGYQQSYSYDVLDRLTKGPAGSETYGSFPVHGANTLSSVSGQYASYDAEGNMTCRDVDTSSNSTQSCDASQTGATMTYDDQGQLVSWKAPSGSSDSSDSDQFLYDNSGNRVLQRATSNGVVSDTITFDGMTDVTISNGTTSTTKYYSVGGSKVAMSKDGVLSYLLSDLLGSASLALNANGSAQAVELYRPFGGTNYSEGTMPTPYNFTGQRLDALTGLLYYSARYYDPVSARFTSADDTDGNGSGDDPYAYVKGNPETATDPSGNRMVSSDGGIASASTVSVGGGVTRLVETDPYGVISTSYSTSNYTSWTCTYNCYRSSTWSYYGYANYYGHQIPYTPPPKPKSTASASHPSTAQKAKAVAKTAAKAVVNVVDTIFGVSRSIHDVQTLGGNGSAGAKAAAALDLGFNVLTDITMFTGEGEEMRAADLAAEGGLDLAEGAAEDGALTGIEDMAEDAGEACGLLSFSYNTVVTTAVGKLAIGSLKPGEQVLAYNQQTKKMELEVIRHVWVTHDNDLVDLTLTYKTTASRDKAAQQDSEMVHTNMKHPFLTVEKGFIPVSQLKLGMHVIEAGGRIGEVTGWQSKPGIQVMYNLEVTTDHTYTVGAGQWVVHNCGEDGDRTPEDMLNDVSPTLERIDDQVPFPHRNDGTVFKNKESLLPPQSKDYYKEYVVPSDSSVEGPGPKRIVTGGKGEIYYTEDHYKTFTKLN